MLILLKIDNSGNRYNKNHRGAKKSKYIPEKKQETKKENTKEEAPDDRPRNERFQKPPENKKNTPGKAFNDEWGFEI